MTDEAVSIMNTNIEDLTTEDKTKIGLVVAGIAAVTSIAVLGGLFVWKKLAVRHMKRQAETITQPPAE